MKKSKTKERNNALNFIIVNKKQYPELEQAHRILLTQNSIVECIEVANTVERVKKSAIYIIGEFDGNLFDQLRKSVKIFGGNCIISAFRNNLTIPKSANPVFSLTLLRKVVTSTGLTPAERIHVKDRVSWMGGLFVNALTDSVTHLISNNVGSKKYKIARKLKLEIVLPTWIDHLWRVQSIESADNFRCPSLKGLVISLSGFSASDRVSLKKIIERNGGEYSVNVRVSHCTHLVVPIKHVLSDKIKTAKKNNIYIVTPNWLYESDKSFYCADEALHRMEVGTFTETVSLFAEETQDIPSFSQIESNFKRTGPLNNTRIFMAESPTAEISDLLDYSDAKLVDDISMATHVLVNKLSETSNYTEQVVVVDGDWLAQCVSSDTVEPVNNDSQIDSSTNIVNSQCSTIQQNDIISQYDEKVFDGLKFSLIDDFDGLLAEQIVNNGGEISGECDYLVSRIVSNEECPHSCTLVTDIWIKCSIQHKQLLSLDNHYFRPLKLKNKLLFEKLAFTIELDEENCEVPPLKEIHDSLVLIIEKHGGLVLWDFHDLLKPNKPANSSNNRLTVIISNKRAVSSYYPSVSCGWVFDIAENGTCNVDLDLFSSCHISEHDEVCTSRLPVSSTPAVHRGRTRDDELRDSKFDILKHVDTFEYKKESYSTEKPQFRLSDAFEMCRSVNDSTSSSAKNDSSLNLSKKFSSALSEAVKNIEGGILRGIVCYLSTPNREDLKKIVLSLGGRVSESMNSTVTHLVLSQSYSCAENVSPDVSVVSPDWIFQCKSKNTRVNETAFAVSVKKDPLINKFVDILAEEVKNRSVECLPDVPSLVSSNISRPMMNQSMPSFEVTLRDDLAEKELKRLSTSMTDHNFDSLLLDDSGTFIGNLSELERGMNKKCVFIFSSMSSQEKEFCGNVLRSLGGMVLDTAQYVEDCTHLIAGSLSRNEKTLSCIAGGKWVLKISFVYACHSASFIIDELSHQWGTSQDKLNPTQQRLANSVDYWRRYVKSRRVKAFDGWVSDVRVDSETRKGSFERLLIAGGGILFSQSDKALTHVFVDDRSVSSERYNEFIMAKTTYIESYLLDVSSNLLVDASSAKKRSLQYFDSALKKRQC